MDGAEPLLLQEPMAYVALHRDSSRAIEDAPLYIQAGHPLRSVMVDVCCFFIILFFFIWMFE